MIWGPPPDPRDFQRHRSLSSDEKAGAWSPAACPLSSSNQLPEAVAMKMTGHKPRSVFERYNIVSPGDLLEAARKLDAATNASAALGMNAPIPGTLPTENSANLLHFNNGPVAQKDRAAVS